MFAHLSRALLAAVLIWSYSLTVAAAEKTAAELLPASVVAYVEVPQPAKLINTVLDHPLAKEIEKHPDYQKYLQSPQYQQAQEVQKVVEDKLGLKLRDAASKLTADGLYLGGDLGTQGVVLLIRSADEKLAEKARDTVVELVRADAAKNGRPDPYEVEKEGETTVYRNGDIRFTTHGRWTIVANKGPLLSAVLGNCSGDGGATLSKDSQFTSVHKDRSPDATAWAYVDLRLVRTLGLLKFAVEQNKSDNPAIELLIGGIIGALPDASYATSTIKFDGDKLGLTLSLPARPKVAAKNREFYFGAAGDGQAPPLLEPKQTLLSVSTYRDFASLWRHAPDLFNDQVNAKFAEAEAGLSTFFSGRNFRDEILGNLQPGMQLVVARQEYNDVTPALKLPAGAIVVRMKNPEETARIFKITFQSAIGFINVLGGMNGVDPFDVNAEKVDGMVVVAAEYLPPKDPAVRKAASPQYNASPTAVFVGDKFILSSSKSLALELAELVRQDPRSEKDVNTAIKADVKSIRTMLLDNQESLVTQNMLEKGHDRGAAEKEIKGLLDALGAMKATALKLSSSEKLLSFTWEVELNRP